LLVYDMYDQISSCSTIWHGGVAGCNLSVFTLLVGEYGAR
jgi:hypothetical protein